MRNRAPRIHLTVRRASVSARFRLWAEVDGDFGVVLAQSNTLAGLRRNAAWAIRKQWSMGHLEGTLGRDRAGVPPEIVWHRSTRRYARLAGRDLTEIRRRWRESERRIRRIERRLLRSGAYSSGSSDHRSGPNLSRSGSRTVEAHRPLRGGPVEPVTALSTQFSSRGVVAIRTASECRRRTDNAGFASSGLRAIAQS